MKKSSTDSIRVQSAKNNQIVIDKRKHKQRFFFRFFWATLLFRMKNVFTRVQYEKRFLTFYFGSYEFP